MRRVHRVGPSSMRRVHKYDGALPQDPDMCVPHFLHTTNPARTVPAPLPRRTLLSTNTHPGAITNPSRSATWRHNPSWRCRLRVNGHPFIQPRREMSGRHRPVGRTSTRQSNKSGSSRLRSSASVRRPFCATMVANSVKETSGSIERAVSHCCRKMRAVGRLMRTVW